MEARADASLRSPTAMVMTPAIPATQEVDLFEYQLIARGGRPGFLGGRDLTGPADSGHQFRAQPARCIGELRYKASPPS